MGSAPSTSLFKGNRNGSSCYKAQANLKVKLKVESQTHGVDGRKREVEAVDVAKRIALRSAPGCWLSQSDGEVGTARQEDKEATVRCRCDSGSRGVKWRKQREGLVISCSRQIVAGGHRAGLDVLDAKNLRNFTWQVYQPNANWCSHGRKMLT